MYTRANNEHMLCFCDANTEHRLPGDREREARTGGSTLPRGYFLFEITLFLICLQLLGLRACGLCKNRELRRGLGMTFFTRESVRDTAHHIFNFPRPLFQC